MTTGPYSKILAGLVSVEANLAEVAEALHRNIIFLTTTPVPGAAKDRANQRDREDENDPHGQDPKRAPPILGMFPDEAQDYRNVALLAARFHLQTGGHLDASVLQRVLQGRGTPAAELARLLFVFDAAARERVDEPTFRFWITDLVDHVRSIRMADAFAHAIQAVESRWEDPNTKVVYTGPDDALELVHRMEAVPGMRRDTMVSMPSGNIRAETAEHMAEVEAAAAGDRPEGSVLSGIRFIDRMTDSFRPGDFIMIGAASGEGKTQMAHNWAWHAAVEQSRNVLILTIETHRIQYRRRLYCRHSNKPGVGRVQGIPYTHIKNGQFADEAERELYARVLADIRDNPAYGVIDVTQAPYGMTVPDVRDAAHRFEDRYGVPLHLIVVDETRLMGAETRRRERRDELNDILRGLKAFATSHDNGRGTVVAAPHQIPRDSRNNVKAEEGKFYTMRDFSDTSEAEKSADVAVMMLRTEELEKQHELAASVVKCRDAEAPPTVVRLFERYKTSFIGNLQTG